MARMIRKQVYIEPRQDQLLKALAEDLGVTEAELIRQGIDRGLANIAGFRPDAAAWKKAERYILGRMRAVSPSPRGRGRISRTVVTVAVKM